MHKDVLRIHLQYIQTTFDSIVFRMKCWLFPEQPVEYWRWSWARCQGVAKDPHRGEALLALIIGKCLAVVDGGACLGGAAASSYNGTTNMSQQFVTFTA